MGETLTDVAKLKAKNEHQGFSVILCELGTPTETDSKISSA